ncbi:MAG: cytochrome d ubiquinol oxidase subunit II [Pseudomonadales bacterium]|nr:cytochrome d ubiquinol oxidase subunit II [Pseudomonadales bacterium]
MNDLNILVMTFAGLMALAILVYAILDGYDLGVGILLPLNQKETDRDVMIASIGPFWDANETWLVLAVGLLLIAFPPAYNLILKELYLPATLMLVGLILRGVAFDFRAKVSLTNKRTWDLLFKAGSTLTALMQGYMLGQYVVGFENTSLALAFSGLSALCVTAAYGYIGAAWLVMKTEGDLQKSAAAWGRTCGRLCFLGVATVCIVNPLLNENVFSKWFSLPNSILWFHIPVVSLLLFVVNDRILKRIPLEDDHSCWIPFVGTVGIFFLCFQGLVYSFYPYAIPGRLTLLEAASAPESLSFILIGALLVVPIIIIYTVFSYRVFWGKATELRYY